QKSGNIRLNTLIMGSYLYQYTHNFHSVYYVYKFFPNEAMKPSQLKEHLTKIHGEKADKAFFQTLKEQQGWRSITSLFTRKMNQSDSGPVASYNISLLIAKCGQPYTVGEKLVLPAIRKVISTVLERDPTQVLKSIPLSNYIVARRINKMGADTEEQLYDHSQQQCFKAPSSEDMAEEFLFSKYLKTDTKGQTIFNALYGYLQEKSIPITNILACATDDAPSMVGRYHSFTALLKEQVLKVRTVLCILHHHNLVAKCNSPPLNESLNIAVKAVNKIKAHALNDRLFRLLCQENDEIFERRLLLTNVRWLSRGNCLVLFYYRNIVEFLESIGSALGEQVTSSHCDIMYLADFFEKMNKVTLKLQGNGFTLVQCKAVDKSHLQVSEELTDDRLFIYVEHLKTVRADLKMRFWDLLDLEVPVWVVQPFQADVVDCDIVIQEHLVDVQCDVEAQAIFRTFGWGSMWTKYATRYPTLWEKARLLLLVFPTTYLVEQGFSQVLHMQSKYRNRLNLATSGALWLKLSSLQPAIKKLAEKHQVQGSH
uniref:HAT C-terminal dimerisation domain-containing protein n=1 Tax=Xiphophorus couchianus TaxID=32473 RepID=A0A3B5LGI6_9TELE